jgi:hypothetical protein
MKANKKCSCISGCRGIGLPNVPNALDETLVRRCSALCDVVEQGNDSVMVVISFHVGPLCW